MGIESLDPRSTHDTTGSVYVDVAHLMRLEWQADGLHWQPPSAVRSVLSGSHASRLRGRGLNFDEIRGYVPGDDIRHIDWKASLRLGRPLVRAYTEERDRPLTVLVDQRMTMYFGSQHAFKSVVAAEAAALAVWMAWASGDRAGGVVFDDTGIVHVRPARSRRTIARLFGAVATMNQALHAEHPTDGKPDQQDVALAQLLAMAPHDHLIVVISDFAGAGARTRQWLRQLRTHNDVVAAMVFDPLWQAPASHGTLVVSGGRLQVEVRTGQAHVRKPVAEFFSGRAADVAELLRTSGVPWMPLTTAEPCVDQWRRWLGMHARRGLRQRPSMRGAVTP